MKPRNRSEMLAVIGVVVDIVAIIILIMVIKHA
jgi:hypothetical protein